MSPVVTLKDPSREAHIFTMRTLLSMLLVVMLLGLLLARYFSLQITEYEIYRTESDRNRVQLQPLPPKRGLIYDRNGVLLADNRPSYLLSIVRERVPDLEATLAELETLLPVSENDLEKFHQRLQRRRPYEAVPLRFRLTEEERAKLAVNRYRLPGVVVDAQLLRHYPQGELFSHALGYVGRISEQELWEVDETNYRGTHHIGKIGVEKFYEDILHGQVGYQNVETNAHGRVLRVLERSDPMPGADIYLHLDSRLQQAALDALGEQRGAVVAIDTRTGGILALVSKPGFDINLFVNGISSKDYSALRDSPDLPLFNRAIQGQYPPGSTVKPIVGLAGLELGVVTAQSTIADPGWYSLPGDRHRYRDWTLKFGRGHGAAVDLHSAIEESCDVYFYDLAHKLEIDRIHDFLSPFGLGDRTGVDTTHERRGVLPSTRWKRDARAEPWYPGETLSVGIGQGYMVTTPVQLAVATSVIATRGERRIPRMLRAVDGQPQPTPDLEPVQADPANWDVVHAAMRDVVHGEKGSARAQSKDIQYTMAGKTGTAQVIGIAQGERYNADEIDERHRDHGLFIAFAPYENPTVALAVVAENGGGGSSVAAPIARQILDAYFSLFAPEVLGLVEEP